MNTDGGMADLARIADRADYYSQILAWPDIVAAFGDPDLRVQCRTWLPGDFNPADLHRLSGWRLRLYRGSHRSGAWTVDGLTEAVTGQLPAARAAHRRSLRRPLNPGPIFIGTRIWPAKFYVPPDPTDPAAMTATLTLEPDDGDRGVIPALAPVDITADEAATGPIITADERPPDA